MGWLPFPMPGGQETMLIYVIISILFGFYFRYIEAIIPTEISINSLDCTNNTNLDVSIGIKSLENRSFNIDGHVYLNFDIDETIDLNVVKLDRDGGVERRYLKEVKLCKLLDKAGRSKFHKSISICPIKAQKFEVDQVVIGDSSSILGVPYRFLNRPMQIELSRNGDTLACLEFDLKSKSKVLF